MNNRDLAIFKTDLGLSERLIPQFPADVIAVSESGIFTAADAARARAAGAHAVLVGEALMKAEDPASPARRSSETVDAHSLHELVSVCRTSRAYAT